ncbi:MULTISPECIES: fluoride efflux transporter CrcB [Bartonella]|uniref:fluoride efflux transporter CrcB n=1 Tax=Bartonella TaxID=773 RepID=UPI0018DB511E|nr:MULTISPECIES: fluoride efflux transporter CrcB [Bartonella]MBH9976231.1 fluoride efflux transporter CrcB [Bartonella choladocola]MBI0015905.1 fluoride efflux transporter CrcB [Bartonella sp. B10834G3]
MSATLWVAFGGALGTVLRYWLSLLMVPVSKNLPWGTILINIVGSFVIAFFGVITMSQAKWPMGETIRLFVMVGICGGFTTFSSFSLQSFELLKKGAVGEAFLNIIVSVAFCLFATALGFYLGSKINH